MVGFNAARKLDLELRARWRLDGHDALALKFSTPHPPNNDVFLKGGGRGGVSNTRPTGLVCLGWTGLIGLVRLGRTRRIGLVRL